jgi:hypothetical protein
VVAVGDERTALGVEGPTQSADQVLLGAFALRRLLLAGPTGTPLARHRYPLLEELTAPHSPGLAALHRAGEAVDPQQTSLAHPLREGETVDGVGEPEVASSFLARDLGIEPRTLAGRVGPRRHEPASVAAHVVVLLGVLRFEPGRAVTRTTKGSVPAAPRPRCWCCAFAPSMLGANTCVTQVYSFVVTDPA